MNKNKYFIFMDESGNNTQDRYFVLGILMVKSEKISELFNFLENISSEIKNRSREKMAKRIDLEYNFGNVDKILNTAKSHRSFEMKFRAINKENEDLYIDILNKYFKLKDVRMCVLVLDKKDESINFQPDGMSHWQRYINNAAMLIENNIRKISNGEFVVLADQITQPSGADDYENTLVDKIRSRLNKKNFDENSIWGALRIESHSSSFLQLVDIFVGAVNYDCLGDNKYRKENFVSVLRDNLRLNNNEKLDHNINRDPNINKEYSNYFSVWKYWNKKRGS